MRRPIGDILVEKGLITSAQLEAAVVEQRSSGKLLGEVLIEQGVIDRLALASALGAQWNPAVRQHVVQKAEAGHADGGERRRELDELRDMVIDLQVKVARLEIALDQRT